MQITLAHNNLPMQKKIIGKGPSFIPNPTNFNWLNSKRDFDNFVSKWRWKNADPQLDSRNTLGLGK